MLVRKGKDKIISISMGKPTLTELFEELTKQEIKPEIKEVKKEDVKAV